MRPRTLRARAAAAGLLAVSLAVIGVVTVTVGTVTPGRGTVGVWPGGGVFGGVGAFGAARPHFFFHAPSVWLSRASKPLGWLTLGALGPLNALEGCAASAVA